MARPLHLHYCFTASAAPSQFAVQSSMHDFGVTSLAQPHREIGRGR